MLSDPLRTPRYPPRVTREATERFMDVLTEAGLTVSLRRSRGDEVLAACGQSTNQNQ